MQYLLLIYQSEATVSALSKSELAKTREDYLAFIESIKKSGHFLANNGLQSVGTSRTIRVRDERALSTDGPFAETREQLGGYFLIEAATIDEAAAIAARIPSARFGSIEVRPVRPT